MAAKFKKKVVEKRSYRKDGVLKINLSKISEKLGKIVLRFKF